MAARHFAFWVEAESGVGFLNYLQLAISFETKPSVRNIVIFLFFFGMALQKRESFESPSERVLEGLCGFWWEVD